MKNFFFALSFVLMLPLQAVAEEIPLTQHEEIMVNKVWLTTGAVDEANNSIPATDSRVSSFFGLAQYYPDNTFKMLTLTFEPKLSGDWSFEKDGKERTIIAKDSQGKILFVRTVENVTVTPEEYTYRIYPDSSDKTHYFDIVHKPLF